MSRPNADLFPDAKRRRTDYLTATAPKRADFSPSAAPNVRRAAVSMGVPNHGRLRMRLA